MTNREVLTQGIFDKLHPGVWYGSHQITRQFPIDERTRIYYRLLSLVRNGLLIRKRSKYKCSYFYSRVEGW
jgi:hypothetical protein